VTTHERRVKPDWIKQMRCGKRMWERGYHPLSSAKEERMGERKLQAGGTRSCGVMKELPLQRVLQPGKKEDDEDWGESNREKNSPVC